MKQVRKILSMFGMSNHDQSQLTDSVIEYPSKAMLSPLPQQSGHHRKSVKLDPDAMSSCMIINNYQTSLNLSGALPDQAGKFSVKDDTLVTVNNDTT